MVGMMLHQHLLVGLVDLAGRCAVLQTENLVGLSLRHAGGGRGVLVAVVGVLVVIVVVVGVLVRIGILIGIFVVLSCKVLPELLGLRVVVPALGLTALGLVLTSVCVVAPHILILICAGTALTGGLSPTMLGVPAPLAPTASRVAPGAAGGRGIVVCIGC